MKFFIKLIKYLFPKTFEILDQKRVRFKMRKPLKWASNNCSDTGKFMKNIDIKIFNETNEFKKKFESRAERILSKSKVWQGGGGAYDFLYFLVMKTKPFVVLETGVASGFSTNAILTALKNLQFGQLYSSDLPYPNTEGSKEAIGILVEEENKKNWTLCIDGDEKCLKKINDNIKRIDIFHYDSDKSYESRKFAWDILKSKFEKNTIIIYDDIHNNFHFRDLVNQLKVEYKVFKFENKYVGIFVYGGKLEFNYFFSPMLPDG